MKYSLKGYALLISLTLLMSGEIMAEEQVDNSFGELNLSSSRKTLLYIPFDGNCVPVQAEGSIEKKQDS